MGHVDNGVSAAEFTEARWQKAELSNSQGQCVEVAGLADGQVAIRNSRDPKGPALVYTKVELAAFLHGAKNGEFDHLVS